MGTNPSPPVELQVGWLLDRYGVALMGDTLDVKLVIRATKLVSIHRVFAKLCMPGGQKHLTQDEWKMIDEIAGLRNG